MKLKDIAAICRRKKRVVLYQREDCIEQYIGDGSSIYLLEGLPRLTVDSVLKIFDVAEKERGKWVAVERPMPESICVADCCAERATNIGRYPDLEYGGYQLVPLKVSDGIVMLQKEYLNPLGKSMYLQFFERRTESGTLYIAVKDGLELKAILFPVFLMSEFYDIMKELAEGASNRYINSKLAADCVDMGLKIDPSTGEVEDGDGK